MSKTQKSIKAANKKLKAQKNTLAKADKDAAKVLKKKHELEAQQNKLLEQKKSHWRRGDEVDREIKTTVDTIKNAERNIFRCPRDIANGLKFVQKIVESKKIKGAHGPLFDLFTLKNPKYRTAVETIAHNSLFNYVVDTERLASTLIRELEKNYKGRVTFMPLDRLRKKNVTYPKGAIPLVTRLKYNAKYEDVFMQVSLLVLG